MRGVLVHYHEVGLKGRNRKLFERSLMDNIARATADIGDLEIRRLPGRILVDLPEAIDADAVAARIANVYGIANLSVVTIVRADFDLIAAEAEQQMRGDYETFAVRARVAHSEFPMKQQQINEKLGALLLEAHGKRVNLSAPERTCHVEIVANRAMVYTQRLAGAGGLPVGTGGHVAVLLSAGIDSPVAAARLMRRGATCSFIHFHSQPFTDASSVRNVTEISQILVRGQYEGTLHLVPLAPAQQAIVAACPEPLRTLLYRRMMMRIATALAQRTGAQALVTGDSLGQVASQTLENLSAVEDAAGLPVLRPLIGLDKLEIIDQAQRLETFEPASAPCQEACVLFEPRRPATKARVVDLRRAEAALDLGALVEEALAGASEVALRWPDPRP